MATKKTIYWHNNNVQQGTGYMHANVHILVGYNQGTIDDYQKMAAVLRKTFPQAKDDEIYGGKIFKSSFYHGHTIIAWQGYIPRSKYPGWEQKTYENGFEYFW